MIFLNKKGELLLQKRGSYAKNGEDVAFFGGGLEKDEMPSQALVREMKEELGLELDMFDYSYLGKFEHINEDKTWRMLRYAFIYESELDVSKINVMEGEGAEYYSVDDARKQKFPSDVSNVLDFVEKIISERK